MNHDGVSHPHQEIDRLICLPGSGGWSRVLLHAIGHCRIEVAAAGIRTLFPHPPSRSICTISLLSHLTGVWNNPPWGRLNSYHEAFVGHHQQPRVVLGNGFDTKVDEGDLGRLQHYYYHHENKKKSDLLAVRLRDNIVIIAVPGRMDSLQ